VIIEYLDNLEIPETTIDGWYAISADYTQDQIKQYIKDWIAAGNWPKDEVVDVLVLDRQVILVNFGGLPRGGWEEKLNG